VENGLTYAIVCTYTRNVKPKNKDKKALVEKLARSFDSKFYKSLSEPVRQQLIKYLMLHGRSDIGTIAKHLPQDRSVISRHLRLMQEAGILICEKEGKFVYYSVNGQEFLAKLESLVEQIRACIPICCPTSCCGKRLNTIQEKGHGY